MNILVCTHLFLPRIGGAEIGIYEIYKRIAENHNVRILCPEIKGLDTNDSDYNFEVKRFKDSIGLNKHIGHGILKGVIPPFSFSAISALNKHIDEFKPDVINLHYAIPYGLAAIKVNDKCPVVLSIVGREVPGPETPYFWKYYIRHIVNNVKTTAYISEYCRSSLFGPNTSNGIIIPYGADLDEFSQVKDPHILRERHNIGDGDILLLSLQRLSKEKRVDVVIKAHKIICEHHDNVKLMILGSGSEKNELESLAKELGISDKVIFTGYVESDELALYLSMCDIFVFHSAYETFGIVLAEAMAAGKPIVSVNSTAIPGVVDDGINGLLTEPLNPGEFAKTVLKLVEDEKLRETLGNNGLKKAKAEYNWDKVAQRYEDLLSEVASGSG